MTKYEDFRLFCEHASESQLQAIIEKEREFADTDEERAAYAAIAEAVQRGREKVAFVRLCRKYLG